MVTNKKQHSAEIRSKQASNEVHSEPNKIGASTPYDFSAKNLTPYGGLLPVATMLEKIGFEKLINETVTVKRITKAMTAYQFILSIVLGLYVGFARLYQLRFIARDPLLAGILKVANLPPQCTFWRFLNSLHTGVPRQIQSVQRRTRESVWAAGNIALKHVTIDTDTTVHTLYGAQMGARKSYNPKNKGKKSYQPILSFIAETKEFAGENCAMATGLPANKLENTWRKSFNPCLIAWSQLPPAPIPASIAGKPCRPTKSSSAASLSWRVRRRAWWRNWLRRNGNHRRTRMPTNNANFDITPKAGAKHIGSLHCVMKKTRKTIKNRRMPCSTSCSRPRNTNIVCS